MQILPAQMQSPIEQALALALYAHDGQKQLNGLPYILHPIHLSEQFQDAQRKIVALLHDSVEDSKGRVSLEMIRELFGNEIANVVGLLTHQDGEPYEAYIQRIAESENRVAYDVKIADLEHNMDVRRMANKGVHKKLPKYIAAWDYLSHLRNGQKGEYV